MRSVLRDMLREDSAMMEHMKCLAEYDGVILRISNAKCFAGYVT